MNCLSLSVKAVKTGSGLLLLCIASQMIFTPRYRRESRAGLILMSNLKRILMIMLITNLAIFNLACTGSKKTGSGTESFSASGEFTVYIVNTNIHTGILIPVGGGQTVLPVALQYFKDIRFADFGWGEEVAYQDTGENYYHDIKAVLLPNPSVIRIEGYSGIGENFGLQSDFTIRLLLSADQFYKLAEFIDRSFKKGNNGELTITSTRHSGNVIFFKSVYSYHMFNTCNTWVATALQSAGLDVSPFFIITSGQLYNEIKDKGTVLKSLK